GRKKLTALTRDDVRDLVAAKLAERKDPNNPQSPPRYSPATIKRMVECLRCALNYALEDDKIARNVAARVEVPGVEAFVVRPVTTADAGRILDAIQSSRWPLLHEFCLLVGCRLSEALGLAWADVDLDEGCVLLHRQLQENLDGHLERTPTKTKNH